MDAKDLMIWDWVYYGKKPVKVLQLSEGKDYKHITPIPLTPEILEKNGFEILDKKNKYYLVPGDPSLALKKEGNIGANGYSFTIGHFWEINDDFRWFVEIQYIHELQHCLKLVGIDKNIVL